MIPGAPYSAPMGYGMMGPPGLASSPPTGSRPRFDTSFVDGKCFIGGLDLSTDKDRLADYCSQWGELSDVVVMSGRGFGFATFADPQNATAFLANKDHLIDGRHVEVKAALPRGQQAPNPAQNQSVVLGKIFVGGTGDLREPDLRDYFSQFGEITDAVVVSHPDGGSRGFGFVTFTDEQSAISCAGQRHMINGQTVEVKRATPRESDMGGRGGPARRGGRFGGGRGYGGRGGGGYGYGGMGGYGDDMAGGYGGGGYGRGYGGYGGYGMRGAAPDYAGYGAPPAAAAAGMGMGAAGYGGAGMRGAGYMGGAATGLDAGYGAGYGAAGGYDAGYGMGPGLEAPMASAPMMSAPMSAPMMGAAGAYGGMGAGGAAMRYRPY